MHSSSLRETPAMSEDVHQENVQEGSLQEDSAQESSLQQAIAQQVKQWLEEVVIGFNFCPFARRELEAGRVRFTVIEGSKVKQAVAALLDELHFLDKNDAVETTLLIFADGWRDFYQFLDMLEVAQMALEDVGYEGVYQLASFHPEYVFEGEDFDDASNYTNRAPYPVIHLLREVSIELAVEKHPDPDGIPVRNQALAREKGAAFWASFLKR